jgi:hypothetical protein
VLWADVDYGSFGVASCRGIPWQLTTPNEL